MPNTEDMRSLRRPLLDDKVASEHTRQLLSSKVFLELIDNLSLSGGIVKSYAVDLTTGNLIETFDSPYFTALVWDELLPFLPDLSLRSLTGAVDFLCRSGSPETGWYFFPDSNRYPPDTDDTAVIADFLMQLGALKSPDQVVKLLEANRKADGSYYVWLESDSTKRWKETTDKIVDINISRFLLRACGEEYEPPSSITEILSGFPLTAQSVYSKDTIVCCWFVSRLERVVLPTGLFTDRKKRATRLATFLRNMGNVSHHSGLAASTASTYGLPEYSLLDPQTIDTIRPMFYHEISRIGYACPTLEIAASCRATLLAANNEHHTSVSGGA